MSALAYVEHVTREGERWDALAHRYYGSAHLYGHLVDANPEVAVAPILPSGLVLRIPLLSEAEAAQQVDRSSLPPWKRLGHA